MGLYIHDDTDFHDAWARASWRAKAMYYTPAVLFGVVVLILWLYA